MTKRTKLSAAAVLALATMFGCDGSSSTGDDGQHETDGEVGSVKLSLVGRGASGDAYVLRNATIMVQGPSSTRFYDTEENPERTVITETVPAGDYYAFLQEGWRLERINQQTGERTPVPAQLTTGNPLYFSVSPNDSTFVSLGFRSGDDVIGMGSFEIGIAIDESDGDGGVGQPGYCRSDAECGEGETCCLAGFLGTCVELSDGGTCPLPDLTISADTAEQSLNIRHESFAADSCALAEGCVDGAGDRRLLAFSTETPNVGEADMILGPPSEDLGFEYSSCHGHYHFEGYATYQLLDQGGNVVRTGHKQAFCLLDYNQVDGNAGGGRYHCGFQGISAGWSDVYGSGLDCQWVDITGVDPGSYVLSIVINQDHTLPESNYDNNSVTLQVTIPEDVPPVEGDPLSGCASGEYGIARDCGWSTSALQAVACTPGEALNSACGCSGGTCSGDPVLRVCAGEGPCTYAEAIASDDDSECGTCPSANFVCPESGVVTVLVGSYAPGDTTQCEPVISPFAR